MSTIKLSFAKWELVGTTLSVSGEVRFYYLVEFAIKVLLSAVVNCHTVNNRHVDYRFLRDDFRLFPSKPWFIALHLVLTLTLPPAPSGNSGWVLFTFSESIDREGLVQEGRRRWWRLRGKRRETRWLLLANPRRSELTWSRHGTPGSLAFRVPLTLYRRLLSSNREFTSTDRPRGSARFSFVVMLYESTHV